MADSNPLDIDLTETRDRAEIDSVVVRPSLFGVVGRLAGTPGALALAALIIATATMLDMSAANDIADAKLYSSRGLNNLGGLRWVAGTRLIVAGIGLLMALIAAARFARDLPTTRYTFSSGGEEATESFDGVEPPVWMAMVVGTAVVVSLLAILLNGVAWVFALHLHESPNFGVPTG
jgi:hypothetical protein